MDARDVQERTAPARYTNKNAQDSANARPQVIVETRNSKNHIFSKWPKMFQNVFKLFSDRNMHTKI